MVLSFAGAVLADLPLGLNPGLLASQIVDFLVVWYVLQRWAFPALFKTLDQRSEKISEGITNYEQSKEALTKAQDQANQIIQDAQRRSQQIISDGTAAGERVRAQIEEEAHKRADEIIQQGHQRLVQEEAQAKNILREQVADLAIAAAGRVIGDSMDGPRQRKLIAEVVAQSPEVK
jgi:F-type H+-transporting ATPase subunit b